MSTDQQPVNKGRWLMPFEVHEEMIQDAIIIERHRTEYELVQAEKRFNIEREKMKNEIDKLKKDIIKQKGVIKKLRNNNKKIEKEAQKKVKAAVKSSMNKYSPDSYLQIKWQEKYNELIQFKQQHGHCDVNVSYKDTYKGLYKWCCTQRNNYKKLCNGEKTDLTNDRIKLLNNINFIWSKVTTQILHWPERFQQLKEYKIKHGHTNVSQFAPLETDPPGLGNWVSTQRKLYKGLQENPNNNTDYSRLTQERINLLNSIGFEWSLRTRSRQPKEK